MLKALPETGLSYICVQVSDKNYDDYDDYDDYDANKAIPIL